MQRPGKEVWVLRCWELPLGSQRLPPLLQDLTLQGPAEAGDAEKSRPCLMAWAHWFLKKSTAQEKRRTHRRGHANMWSSHISSVQRTTGPTEFPLRGRKSDSIPHQMNACWTTHTGWGTWSWIWLPGVGHERVEGPAPMWAGKGTEEPLQPRPLANAEPGQTCLHKKQKTNPEWDLWQGFAAHGKNEHSLEAWSETCL